MEGETYDFRVFAENDAGQGKPCEPITFVAKDPYDPPGKPGCPEVKETTKDSASITWAAPDDDGGSPITNYVVEMRRKGDKKWSVVNKTEKVTGLEYTVPDLKEETEYEFRVTAENKAGQGPPSDPSKPCKYGKMADTFRYKFGYLSSNLFPFLSNPEMIVYQ